MKLNKIVKIDNAPTDNLPNSSDSELSIWWDNTHYTFFYWFFDTHRQIWILLRQSIIDTEAY